MLYLLDTNVIIRFLVGDHKEHLEKSIEIFKEVETAKLQVEILEGCSYGSLFCTYKVL